MCVCTFRARGGYKSLSYPFPSYKQQNENNSLICNPSYENMAEALTSLTLANPCIRHDPLQTTKPQFTSFSKSIKQYCSTSRFCYGSHQIEGEKSKRGSRVRANALPDWPLMAVMVDQMEGQRDLIIHKSIWHLSDEAMKKVYTFYIMFTCWGCCFFGSTKDPYYDSEGYRGDGGDGTGHWAYEKQEDMEESSRAELWREELIEEIEQKVGSLRELEEAGKKEELVK